MRKIALIPTVAEIRTLITPLTMRKPVKHAFIFAWSLWRRKHQAQAMIAHYKKENICNCGTRPCGRIDSGISLGIPYLISK